MVMDITTRQPIQETTTLKFQDAGNPTNHLYVRTGNQSINSAYRIDPTLRIPQSLLSDVAASVAANARNSMQAETQNGSICINVGLELPNNGSTQRLKASLYLRTDNGSVQARIAPTTPRPPFRLSAVSSNGSVSVYIPRSFHGPVSLESGNGTIRLSREVKRDLIVLSEEGGRQKGFIGDLGDYSYDGHTEHGVGMNLDELSLRSGNGMISVYFAQERADDSSETLPPP
ncbi:hypothetical protein ONZ45_g8363 [Pleurotus djamor]|nr:hypothetical protein ONZ45_g8363 [Pleurotus djamor]